MSLITNGGYRAEHRGQFLKETIQMKPEVRSILSAIAILLTTICAVNVFAQDQVKIANGLLEGVMDKSSGVRSFKGIPFGEPPVGELRWKPPPTGQKLAGCAQG